MESADESMAFIEPDEHIHAPLQLAEPQMQRRHAETL